MILKKKIKWNKVDIDLNVFLISYLGAFNFFIPYFKIQFFSP